MFFTYAARELRRRRRQAIVVALGLAVGIGLVVTISAMASGVRAAQGTALQSLYGVGTDVTVTKAATFGSGGPARFGLNPGSQSRQGQSFSRDRILASPGLGTVSASSVSTVRSLPHVSAAAGSLSLTSLHLQGKFIRFGQGSGGGFGQGGSGSFPTARPSVPPVRVSAYSITGVDTAQSSVGPVTAAQVTGGRFFSASESNAHVAVVDQSYAKQHKLAVGSKLTIGGTTFTVIGLASAPAGGTGSDVYVPLAAAQALVDTPGMVNRISVTADSASNIGSVQSEIQRVLPKDTVTTAQDLASQVTGSLASASSLAGSLGRWLSIVALVVAFAVASLLTISAVGRRTREFGTLKALGWRGRRVVGQVVGESAVLGIAGGIAGILLGLAGALLVSRLFPSLQASLGAFGRPAGGGGGGGGLLARAFGGTGPSVTIPFSASVDARLLLAAIALALAGGLIAGALGGWRAARLRPADALRRVE
ncbi:MAG TPA: ABC transporter permease [Actinomycetota bacterium]